MGRSTLPALPNGNASLSPKMALRIDKAFDVSMEILLRMQAWYALRMPARAPPGCPSARWRRATEGA